MWNRQLLTVAGLALGAILTAHFASPSAAQQKQKPAQDDKATAEQDKQKEKELDIQYSKAYLTLMEATLAKYEATNRKLPNTIRPSVMQAIQETVREARERVGLAQNDDTSDVEIYVSGAEADLRAAQEAVKKAEAANLQYSDTVSPEEVTRLKAELEVAKIRLEKARHLGHESPLSNVRFELEQLRADVAELRMFVALLRDRN